MDPWYPLMEPTAAMHKIMFAVKQAVLCNTGCGQRLRVSWGSWQDSSGRCGFCGQAPAPAATITPSLHDPCTNNTSIDNPSINPSTYHPTIYSPPSMCCCELLSPCSIEGKLQNFAGITANSGTQVSQVHLGITAQGAEEHCHSDLMRMHALTSASQKSYFKVGDLNLLSYYRVHV